MYQHLTHHHKQIPFILRNYLHRPRPVRNIPYIPRPLALPLPVRPTIPISLQMRNETNIWARTKHRIVVFHVETFQMLVIAHGVLGRRRCPSFHTFASVIQQKYGSHASWHCKVTDWVKVSYPMLRKSSLPQGCFLSAASL